MSINTPACVTLIPATASNFDQLVASATSSIGNGRSDSASSTEASPGSTTSSGPHETSTTSGASASGTTQASSSQSASAAATSSTSGNAAAGAAKVPMLWMYVGTGLGALAGLLAVVI